MTIDNAKAGALSELPADLLRALVDFRTKRGAKWKEDLLSGWLRASFPGELQRLRNEFGPTWLSRVKNADFGALAPDQSADALIPVAGDRRYTATEMEAYGKAYADAPVVPTEPDDPQALAEKTVALEVQATELEGTPSAPRMRM